jgi:hypothetical protein
VIIRATEAEMIEAFEKARASAQNLKPLTERVEFGRYRVGGREFGTWYEVQIGRTVGGSIFVACTCAAGLNYRACYHGAEAYNRHLTEVHDPANAPKLKPEGKPAERLGNFRI